MTRPTLPRFLALALALGAPWSAAGAAALAIDPSQIAAMDLGFANAEAASWIPVAAIPARVELAAEARSLLVAPYPGAVQRVLVDDGAQVDAGTPLLALSSSEGSRLAAATEGRRQRLAALARQGERDEALFGAGVLSRRELEARRAELAAARAEARADAGAAAAFSLDANGALLLRAPRDGRVLRRHVAAGDTFAAGDTLVELSGDGGLSLEGMAPARLAGLIAPGMRARIGEASGEVSGVGGGLDPDTRALTVTARLPAAAALPGALVELRIERDAPAGTTRVPAAAVIRVGGRDGIYVRRGEAIERVEVEVAFRDDAHAWIAGANAGDAVVSRGVLALKAVSEAALAATED